MLGFTHIQYTDDALRASANHPDQISWGPLAEIGGYKIEYVKWAAGTVYPDHTHLDAEHIFLISGDLSDGETDFLPRSLITYPAGSRHDRLRTEGGAEFILMFTGKERVKGS
jgi:anti-sigma factor ChrR (cupin superfamily)